MQPGAVAEESKEDVVGDEEATMVIDPMKRMTEDPSVPELMNAPRVLMNGYGLRNEKEMGWELLVGHLQLKKEQDEVEAEIGEIEIVRTTGNLTKVGMKNLGLVGMTDGGDHVGEEKKKKSIQVVDPIPDEFIEVGVTTEMTTFLNGLKTILVRRVELLTQVEPSTKMIIVTAQRVTPLN